MIGHPIWYELMVPDAAAVAPLYRAVLGWDIPATGHAMPNGSEYRMIGRTGGGHAGGMLTLTPAMAEAGVRLCWQTYFHVPDVDAAFAKAIELGGTEWMAPVTMGGAGRMAMVSDPMGAPFYLMTPTPPPDQPDAKSDVFDAVKPGHCRWNQLDTSDAARADGFYKALFGWNTDSSMPMGALGDYRFIEVAGQQIGAINPAKDAGEPDMWLPYFGVAEIGAARTAALANGFTITMDTHQVPGDDWIFMGRDPAGVIVGFVGPNGAST